MQEGLRYILDTVGEPNSVILNTGCPIDLRDEQMSDDLKFVAAILAASRLAGTKSPTPEKAARCFLDAFAELEASNFEFPDHKAKPDQMIEDDVDPIRLSAR